MKIYPQQLEAQLKKGLHPAYVVSGDAPLLIEETVEKIKSVMLNQNYSCFRFHIDLSFDWDKLKNELENLSLFTPYRLIELKLTNFTWPEHAKAWLTAHLNRPSPDIILLFSVPKLDIQTQALPWIQSILEKSVWIPIWPPQTPSQWYTWMDQRAKKMGLVLDRPAIQCLIKYTEGNLYAAKQAIDQLMLYASEKQIKAKEIETFMTQSAHFDAFKFMDTLFTKDKARAFHMLQTLAALNYPPTLLLFTLHRYISMLLKMKYFQLNQKSLHPLFKTYRLRESKQRSIELILKDINLHTLTQSLIKLSKLDATLKGAEKGMIWENLQCITLDLLKEND